MLDVESTIWSSGAFAYRKARRLVAPVDAEDVVGDAIKRLIELAPYLRRDGLAGYFIKTAWSLAITRLRRRRAQGIPMSPEDLVRAEVRARHLDHGGHIGPMSTDWPESMGP